MKEHRPLSKEAAARLLEAIEQARREGVRSVVIDFQPDAVYIKAVTHRAQKVSLRAA